MTQEKVQSTSGQTDDRTTDAADQNGAGPRVQVNPVDPPGSEASAAAQAGDATADVVSSDADVVTPIVEVLPPAEDVDPMLRGNVSIDRTQFSFGLSGVTLKRTRMSSANEDESEQEEPTGDADTRLAEPSETTAAADSAGQRTASGDVHGEAIASIQLFTRFLIGAAIYGYDEVLTRLNTFEQAIDENPDDYDLTDHLIKQLDETEDDVEALFRYWSFGMLLWSQRTAYQITDRSFRMSLNAGSAALRTADRTTDSFLLRPFSRPFKRAATALANGTKARIAEGRTVETKDRVLAELTLNDIISDVIDYMSENPQLAELVSEQGIGFVNTVMDNGRQIGTISDNAVENLVRKIFRRQPRQDMPPSPLAGKAQTMYDPSSEQFNVPKEKKE